MFLGPDIGFVNVFERHSTDGDCLLNVQELVQGSQCEGTHSFTFELNY